MLSTIFKRHHLSVITYEEITSGFSMTQKYLLTTHEKQYILKIYPLATFERIQQQRSFLSQHQKNHVHCQLPIFYDTLEQWCYTISEYLAGKSLDRLLPCLSQEKQYELGMQAGQELQKIHLLACPNLHFNWYQARLRKYQQKKEQCAKLGLNFHQKTAIETFIDKHFHLLKESTVCFQHDDFHPQNLLYDNQKIIMLDFDSFDWGDPWEEFFKLPKYTVSVSQAFANGQLMGYFERNIPQNFWKKYHLFVALNCHASQIGGYQSGNLASVQLQTKKIIQTHSFSNQPPQWLQQKPTS